MKLDSIPSRTGRGSIALAILTALAGLFISLQIRSRIAQSEIASARLAAETLRLNTERELTLFVEVLESVRALHALSDEVNQAAMNEFIKKGLVHQHTVLGAFGLAQRIDSQLRIEIEQKEKAGPGAYDIVQKGPEGAWIPSEQKPAYYPLTWESQSGALGVPVGFDFSSTPNASRTIQQIERTRQTALVPSPISFPKRAAPTYWVFAPVMPHQAPSRVIGFAVAKLDPAQILQRVSATARPVSELHLNLTPAPNSAMKESIKRKKGAWHYRHPMRAMNTEWVFECVLPVSLTGHRSAIALFIGLLLTALMTSQLLILGDRTRKIEAKVRTRTRELHQANTQLEEHLRERAQMEEEMHELAARERRKIGRDLHDSLGQKLTGAVFLSRSLLNHFKKSGEEETHAKTLNETLKSAVGQVRNMARGLAPVTLNDESLGEALEQLADEMTGLYAVSCELTDRVRLPKLNRKTKEQLYLIAREAVNNSARHAKAERITIQLTEKDSTWRLRIEDDGKGFPEGSQVENSRGFGALRSNHEGMGIRIMRHRASLIGATFAIQSTPGKGTTITISHKTHKKYRMSMPHA